MNTLADGHPAKEPALPNPPFEGSEKRIELDFDGNVDARGLRALDRCQLDELMTTAHCTIVSTRSNAQFDAYVLSESSLFVYPTKWVLKTCGTTRLLMAIPRLLEMAAELGMAASRCKFSRATFLFPDQQHYPHTSFDDEVEFLNQHLSKAFDDSIGKDYVLGTPYDGLEWHVYANGRPSAAPLRPTYNLEICLTELGEKQAQQFFRTDAFVSAAHTTLTSGLGQLKPGAEIDDYVFEPCGYSMNGILGTGLVTVHITPETGHSYASVEVSGFAEDVELGLGADRLLEKALAIFRPGHACVALTTSSGGPPVLLSSPDVPAALGMACLGSTSQRLDCGGVVAYYSLAGKGGVAVDVLPPGSPKSILHHASSWLSSANTLGAGADCLDCGDAGSFLGDNTSGSLSNDSSSSAADSDGENATEQ